MALKFRSFSAIFNERRTDSLPVSRSTSVYGDDIELVNLDKGILNLLERRVLSFRFAGDEIFDDRRFSTCRETMFTGTLRVPETFERLFVRFCRLCQSWVKICMREGKKTNRRKPRWST